MLRALETSELEEWTNGEKVCDSIAEEVALKQAIEKGEGMCGGVALYEGIYEGQRTYDRACIRNSVEASVGEGGMGTKSQHLVTTVSLWPEIIGV